MILNTASNIIFNGATVQSVIYNHNVIWPTGAPSLTNAWSASGYIEIETATSNYSIYLTPSVNRFTWLGDQHAATTDVVSPTWDYWVGRSQGFTADKHTDPEESGLLPVRHSSVYFAVSAKWSATDNKAYTQSAFLHMPSSVVSGSGRDYTASIDGRNVTSDKIDGFHIARTASIIVTAKSGIIGPSPSSASVTTSNVYHLPYGAAISGTKYCGVGVTARFSASGIYMP